MISWKQVLAATKGNSSFKGDLNFTGVSTDTRTVRPGELFIALQGEKFDGHAYLGQAVKAGAAGVVVSRPVTVPQSVAVLQVPSTLKAYQDIACAYRCSFSNLKVVAVTGSNGKTSTKDMIASCLSARYRVVKTEANFNNEIGLPRTLLNLRPDTQIAVVEIGMRGMGQIKAMCAVARPDVAVITNVGTTHIGLLGSEENIARAKSEILEDLPADGFAVLNGDQPLVRAMSAKLKVQAAWFGLQKNDDFQGSDLQVTSAGSSFCCWVKNLPQAVRFSLPQIGEHNVMNALAAIAVGCHFGISLKEMAEALRQAPVSSMRQEIIHRGAYTIINDAYNASPASMAAALATLRKLKEAQPQTGRSLAVLADMLELGDASASLHRQVGAAAVREKTDAVFTYGTEAEAISQEVQRLGGIAFPCRNREEAAARLKAYLQPGDLVLLKGSHVMDVGGIIKLVF